MTKQEFENWALAHGWEKDHYGHYHKEEYRFKVQSRSVRLEKSATVDHYGGKQQKIWVKFRSGYFSSLSIDDQGKLVGMKK